MGWAVPWYTVIGEGFQEACGTTEYFVLDVFGREGDRAFLIYATTGRGVEALGRPPGAPTPQPSASGPSHRRDRAIAAR